MKKLPTFDDVVEEFKDFLNKEGKPVKILWIHREDLVFARNNIYLKPPNRQIAELSAIKNYELAPKNNFGICIRQIGQNSLYSFCYLYLPKNETEMEYALMSPATVKKSINITDLHIKEINNTFYWLWLRLLEKLFADKSWKMDYPTRIKS